jgi:ATP-binding cassette subfamily B protein
LTSLKKIFPYIFKYHSYLLGGTLFILLSNIFAVVVPPLVRKAIDGLAQMLETGVAPKFHFLIDEQFTSLERVAFIFGMLIVISAIIKGVLMFFMRQTIIVMSRYVEFDLKNTLFKKYTRLDKSFYDKNYTGDLMNRISDDVTKVRMFVGPAIMYTLNLVCLISFSLTLMWRINPKITMLVLTPLPFLAFSIYYVSSKINRQSDIIQKELSGITSFVQEAFSGLMVIKNFGVNSNFNKILFNKASHYNKSNVKLAFVNALFFPVVLFLIGLSTLITLYVGGTEVMNGNFTVGNVAEFMIYVNMLTWPVVSVGYITSLVQRAEASMARINEFLDTPEPLDSELHQNYHFQNEIKFENVSFKYQNSDKWVIKDVSFTIRKGEIVCITGQTGSGKSTLAKLLLGVYRPTSGKICFDGIPIEEIHSPALRKQMSYVDQDVFLFSDSIKNNLLFGTDHKMTDEEAMEFLKQCALDDEVKTFSNGIHTIIGERGVTISGGQKQRLSIGRALTTSAPILILDDSLSAVDTKTEKVINLAIRSQNDFKTIIYISHRLSAFSDAHQILVLNEGCLIEQGTHETLLLQNGYYADLVQRNLVEAGV